MPELGSPKTYQHQLRQMPCAGRALPKKTSLFLDPEISLPAKHGQGPPDLRWLRQRRCAARESGLFPDRLPDIGPFCGLGRTRHVGHPTSARANPGIAHRGLLCADHLPGRLRRILPGDAATRPGAQDRGSQKGRCRAAFETVQVRHRQIEQPLRPTAAMIRFYGKDRL